MKNPLSIRVIKLGGSLLDLKEVCERFDRWMDNQPSMHNVLIVGGGKLIDAVRDLHQRFDLDEKETHWLAVDLLEVTTAVIARQLSTWSVRNSMKQLTGELESNEAVNQLFVAGQWLRTQSDVPESWDVTTDSIAALIACQLNATELVLLKSATAPITDGGFRESMVELSHTGYVDAMFSQSIGTTETVRLVNFRDENFAESLFRL
jgi:aspartokinase-like uncharacterized kinase